MSLILKSERLFLIQPKITEISQLIPLWQDLKVQKYIGGPVSEVIAEERICNIFEHWELHSFGLCSVFDKSSNTLLGLCGLQLSDDGLELSYKFNSRFWGKGFAHESAISVLSYAFSVLRRKEVIAITQSKNASSIKLLGKLGMKYIKDFERYNANQSLFLLKRNQFKSVEDLGGYLLRE